MKINVSIDNISHLDIGAECRRHAPIGDESKCIPLFPYAAYDQWCGDFERDI